MDRRQFTKKALLLAGLAPVSRLANSNDDLVQRKQAAKQKSEQAHQAFIDDEQVKMMGNEKIAMLLYPGCYALDLVNPQVIFKSMMGSEVYLVSTGGDLQAVDASGLSILPTHTMADCPDQLDILFVPGGTTGTLSAMQNPAVIEFIRSKAASSRYVTSVCTGSLLLGKAGLLQNKKATSHWTTLQILEQFGATAVNERVVWDGNLITGGGVTAGIDFGLEIVAALRGKAYAEALQLQLEYNPRPPFHAGSPETAPTFVYNNVRDMFAPLVVDFELAARG